MDKYTPSTRVNPRATQKQHPLHFDVQKALGELNAAQLWEKFKARSIADPSAQKPNAQLSVYGIPWTPGR